MDILRPTFPEADGYDYLASAACSDALLAGACLKQAVVFDFDYTSIADNTVVIYYDSNLYFNVPVWVHTDIGTRALKLAEEDVPEDASDYFAEAFSMFGFREGSLIGPLNTTYGGVAYTSEREARYPQVIILVTESEGVTTVHAVVGIIDNGIEVNTFDNRERAFKTYRPVLILREKVDTTTTISIYDFRTGTTAKVPNSGNTALMNAEGLDPSTYSYILSTIVAGERIQREAITPIGRIGEPGGSTTLDIGDAGCVGKGCTYPPYTLGYCSDPVYGADWIVTDKEENNSSCSGFNYTFVTLFEMESGCADGLGYYHYSATLGCDGSNNGWVASYSVLLSIPDHASPAFITISDEDSDHLYGTKEVSWPSTFSSSKDEISLGYYQNYTYSNTLMDYTSYTEYIRIYINGEYTQVDNPVLADVEYTDFCFGCKDLFYLGFRLTALYFYNVPVLVAAIDNQGTVISGIDIDSIPEYIVDRFDTLVAGYGGNAEDVKIDLVVGLLPYNINQYGLT